jgi:hypothetical protein
MNRRIKKDLKEFFDKQPLTAFEKSFIVGCIKAQNKYPQLTLKQWELIQRIKERYSYGEEPDRSKETSKR